MKLIVKRRARNSDSENGLTRLRDPLFFKQNEVLDSRSQRFKAINCTRRSGKSVGEAIDHFEICEEFPKSRTLYMGLTLDSVSEIIWDIFRDLDEQGKYGCTFNETKKIVKFPNGSRIRLFGLDSSAREIRKALGQKLRKVSIDEAGSMTQDMRKICYQMIRPALADLRPLSWLTLLGTCENIPNTFFEQVTEGKENEADWSTYKWTAYENPHMAKQWKAEIDEMLSHNPLVKDVSWFKTHYLNEWCSDDDLIIIKTNEKTFIAPIDLSGFTFVLGVDLGFNDATSFSMLAYSVRRACCYVVEASKDTQMDFTDTANTIRTYLRKYRVSKVIVDGANKQGVEEIRRRHQINLQPAEKTEKALYLRLMRDDVIEGVLKVFNEDCNELSTEWESLQWKNDQKKDEDPRCQNHLSDATLYAWRECRHFFYKKKELKPDPNSDEFMNLMEELESKKMENKESEEWWESKIAA